MWFWRESAWTLFAEKPVLRPPGSSRFASRSESVSLLLLRGGSISKFQKRDGRLRDLDTAIVHVLAMLPKVIDEHDVAVYVPDE